MRTHFTFLASSYHGWLIVTPDELAAVGPQRGRHHPHSYRRGEQLGPEEDEGRPDLPRSPQRPASAGEAEIIDDLGSCDQWEHFGTGGRATEGGAEL